MGLDCRTHRRDFLKLGAGLALASAIAPPAMAADPYADARLVPGEPTDPPAGAFTIAVLPDTQNYSEFFPDIYRAQTEWIVENRRRRNIQSVLHLGDITNRNSPREWENATAAMKTLDGKLPYCLVPGNHDYSQHGNCTDRTTLLNEYFPVERFRQSPNFGGAYDKEPDRSENSFHTFTAEGCDFLVVALEFGPRRDVVRWANEVVGRHPRHSAILITHAYMYDDDTRYDWATRGPKQSWNPHSYGVAKATQDDVLDGEQLWQELVSRHDNFLLTLNGHVLHDGLGRTVTATSTGHDVNQVLVNFQMRPKGGDGWLRLLEFAADGKTIQVHDYSPTRNERNESPQNDFVMRI